MFCYWDRNGFEALYFVYYIFEKHFTTFLQAHYFFMTMVMGNMLKTDKNQCSIT